MEDEEEVESREWYMASYAPQGIPTSNHLKLRSLKLRVSHHSIPDGHVALELLFVSVEPYLRTRMSGLCNDGLFIDQFQLNHAITAPGIARVILSKDSKFQDGDVALHMDCPVSEYSIVSENLTQTLEFPYPIISAPWVGI